MQRRHRSSNEHPLGGTGTPAETVAALKASMAAMELGDRCACWGTPPMSSLGHALYLKKGVATVRKVVYLKKSPGSRWGMRCLVKANMKRPFKVSSRLMFKQGKNSTASIPRRQDQDDMN
eukprot:1156138-Pelagomonas_calceolata.AAC.9